MSLLRFTGAMLLWLAAGRGLLHLVRAERLALGWVARVASWLVAGAAAGAFATTVFGVLGLPVRPWPLTGAALVLLAVAGGRRATVPRSHLAPRARLASEVPSLLAMLVSLPYLATAAASWTISNDEYAIWAFKGKILVSLGKVDPFLLAHDPAYAYASRDYPLLVPSVQVWVEGFLGHRGDGYDHLGLGLVIVAAFIVSAALMRLLAGQLVAVLSVFAIPATTGLVLNGTLFVGDATNALLALALFACLALLATAGEAATARAACGLAVVLCAALVMTKNEGSAFAAAALISATLVAPAGRRRLVWVPVAGGAIAELPWALWSRANGLHSNFVTSSTLSFSVIARHLGRLHPLLSIMGRYWPGPKGIVLLAVCLATLAALWRRGQDRRVLIFFLLGTCLAFAALVLTYLVAPYAGDGWWKYNVDRVQFLPGAGIWVIGILAGSALVRISLPQWWSGRAWPCVSAASAPAVAFPSGGPTGQVPRFRADRGG